MSSHPALSRAVPGIVFGLLVSTAVLRTILVILPNWTQTAARSAAQVADRGVAARAAAAQAGSPAPAAQAADRAPQEDPTLAAGSAPAEQGIPERTRVEQRIAGEWSDGTSRLTITKDGDAFRAEYPSDQGLQVLRGELLADSRLRLVNVNQYGRIVRPGSYYQGDFAQESWIQLSPDADFLSIEFSEATGGRSLVMNRIADASDSGRGSGDPATPDVANPTPPDAIPQPPPPSAPPIRVGGRVREPTKIRDVRPDYPSNAQSAGVQGAVILEATIGPDGRVAHATVLRSIPLLDEAAINAVKQWQYSPTLLDGVPVPVIMRVTVRFSLLEQMFRRRPAEPEPGLIRRIP